MDAEEDKEERVERRLEGVVIEEDMGIFDGEIPPEGPSLGPAGAEAAGPYMRGRLRERWSFWKGLGTCQMVLDWVRVGFMAWFTQEVPTMGKPNQESCYDLNLIGDLLLLPWEH